MSYDRGLAGIWGDPAEGARHVAAERPDEEMMIAGVAAGLGFTLAYDSRRQFLSIPGVAYRPLDPPLLGSLGLAWRADDPNPDVRAFVALAVEQLQHEAQDCARRPPSASLARPCAAPIV